MLSIRENIPLAPLTSLQVGGPARFFTQITTSDELGEALEFADSRGLPTFILGGGSNLLVADRGFHGLVINVVPKGITVKDEDARHVRLTAAAGEDWDRFVDYVVEQNLAGIENLGGIPGLVGGTPVQNVGAYGQEVSDTIVEVECFDRTTRSTVTLTNADSEFSYRKSVYNSTKREQYVVMAVTFSLERDGRPNISYKDLSTHFGGQHPSLAEVREAVLKIRGSKSMVIDPADPNSRSAGSFFKNPVISMDGFDQLRDRWPEMPSFNFSGGVKIPAAWLIENVGFYKGFSLGNAGISANHTLALINRGGATAAEIIALRDQIEEAVLTQFGIRLKQEPVMLGFEDVG